jgi:hypothetical protein
MYDLIIEIMSLAALGWKRALTKGTPAKFQKMTMKPHL